MARATRALVGLLSCSLLSCGGAGTSSTDGGRDAPQVLSENTAAMCRDGQDNDGDGFIDCADQDCWVLTFCRGDGGPPYPGDGGPLVDSSLQPCAIHYDCIQGEFCYKGKCLRDMKQAVYHCGKPGCPPGHWCLTQANTKDRCAEDPSYVCQDACDCGPAHCCIMGTCVKDAADPWIKTGQPIVPPGCDPLTHPTKCRCKPGTDATYCCDAPSCHAGVSAHGGSGSPFRCYASGGARGYCGGDTCFGTACNCEAGESCADSIDRGAGIPPPGKSCGVLSGGTCMSNALAEAVLGWKPSDLLPCCATGCSAANAGALCEGGTFQTVGRWASQRLLARCEPAPASGCVAGDGICCSSEVRGSAIERADCLCGNGQCDGTETTASCAADCAGTCGDGHCDSSESPGSCPGDCTGGCADSSLYERMPDRVCGDGACEPHGQGANPACDWNEVETCRTCPQDCGACEWIKVNGYSPAEVQSLKSVWGSGPDNVFAVAGVFCQPTAAICTDSVLRFDGTSWAPSRVDLRSEGTGLCASPLGIGGTPSGEGYIVGSYGLVLRYVPGSSSSPSARP